MVNGYPLEPYGFPKNLQTMGRNARNVVANHQGHGWLKLLDRLRGQGVLHGENNMDWSCKHGGATLKQCLVDASKTRNTTFRYHEFWLILHPSEALEFHSRCPTFQIDSRDSLPFVRLFYEILFLIYFPNISRIWRTHCTCRTSLCLLASHCTVLDHLRSRELLPNSSPKFATEKWWKMLHGTIFFGGISLDLRILRLDMIPHSSQSWAFPNPINSDCESCISIESYSPILSRGLLKNEK